MKCSALQIIRSSHSNEFHFDPLRLQLVQRGFICRLEDQPAKVLAHMLDRVDQNVSRSELVDLLWPSETYGDFSHRLDKVISKLRAALSDDPAHPKFIETLRGHGFRFIGAEHIQCTIDKSKSDLAGAERDAVETIVSTYPRRFE